MSGKKPWPRWLYWWLAFWTVAILAGRRATSAASSSPTATPRPWAARRCCSPRRPATTTSCSPAGRRPRRLAVAEPTLRPSRDGRCPTAGRGDHEVRPPPRPTDGTRHRDDAAPARHAADAVARVWHAGLPLVAARRRPPRPGHDPRRRLQLGQAGLRLARHRGRGKGQFDWSSTDRIMDQVEQVRPAHRRAHRPPAPMGRRRLPPEWAAGQPARLRRLLHRPGHPLQGPHRRL